MKKLYLCAPVIFFVGLSASGTVRQGRATSPVPASLAHQHLQSPAPSALPSTAPDFSQLPLSFIANRGQADSRVAFMVQGRDKSLFFTPGGITIRLFAREGDEISPSGPDHPAAGLREKREKPENWTVKLDFLGADPDVRPVGLEEDEGVFSYFRGSEESWKTGVPSYSKIIYPNLWPGIDLVYSGSVNRLKYEFVVRPGADPSQVRMAYRGATKLEVDELGRLSVETPLGGFHDDTPVAYQEKDGRRVEVAMTYRLETPDQGPARTYGFQVGDYDPSHSLVLDPAVITYCGFVGGSGNELANAIAVDAAGNVYVAGYTYSTEADFPVTVGPDLTFSSWSDTFVLKLSPDGTQLVYCGYIGGDYTDDGYGVAVDGSGCAYVVGRTESSQASFPRKVGPDLILNPFGDGFIAKVNAAGTDLVYCGYIGGNSGDGAYGVAVDDGGNAYVVGTTSSDSTTFPVTVGPDLSFNGDQDAFVAKVNSAGTGFAYCGYLGGSSIDSGWAVAIDSGGSAYLTGNTTSTTPTFPAIVGPDLTFNGGADCFVAKVNASGSALVYCGYIGASNTEWGKGIAVDGAGSAYVVGEIYLSSSTGFPVTVGPDLTPNGGSEDAFIAKVNPAGSGFVYCGYIGGSGTDAAFGVDVDGSNRAHVVGRTNSSEATFPVAGGPDLTYNGSADAFLATVSSSGDNLVESGYIGGSGDDTGIGIAVDASGNAYVCGYTSSTETTFPVMAGPDLTHNGQVDAFVARIGGPPVTRGLLAADTDGDGTEEIVADLGADGLWVWDSYSWTPLSGTDPDTVMAANIDADPALEIVADFGASGVWLLDGSWSQITGANPDGMTSGDVDLDAVDEVAIDFGALGAWIWDGEAWTQLTGSDLDTLLAADVDGDGSAELAADGGALGLWLWDGGAWTMLSGINAEGIIAVPGPARDDLAADFGATGVWVYHISSWTQLAGANAEGLFALNSDTDAAYEVGADFGAIGVWLYDVGWTQLSGLNAEAMAAADLDGDSVEELVMDAGTTGLWIWSGSWAQASALNPSATARAAVDADPADELAVDFGAAGIWLYNGGNWTLIR